MSERSYMNWRDIKESDLRAHRDRLGRALDELLRWQPQTEKVRAGLHPQHLAAIVQAERVVAETEDGDA